MQCGKIQFNRRTVNVLLPYLNAFLIFVKPYLLLRQLAHSNCPYNNQLNNEFYDISGHNWMFQEKNSETQFKGTANHYEKKNDRLREEDHY